MPLIRKQIDQIENTGDSLILSSFDGGLNDTASNEILQDNESIVRQNWAPTTTGALEKVNGFTKKNSTLMGAKPVRGLFRVYQSSGTKKLLAMCNGKLFYSDNEGTAFTQEVNATAYTETDYFTGVNYNNLFFFTGPTQNVHIYTPSANTAAAATNQPTNPCKVLLKRSDRRLLALNNATNGSTLYFSKVDPTGAAADDWSATNDAGSIAIDGSLSEPLVGGLTFGAIDIIFKDYAAFKIWGYPNPEAVRMPGSPGCAAPYSTAQGDGLGFVLAHDGVWMWDGNKFIDISTNKIKTIIDNISPTQVTHAFGVYRDGQYWLFYTESGDTVNKNCIIYDVSLSNPYIGKNVWFERAGLEMNCPVIFNGAGDDNEIYAGDSADTGFVYRLDFSAGGSDNGLNINAINQTKYFDMGYPHLVKRFVSIKIKYYLTVNTLTFDWYVDRGVRTGQYSGSTAGGTVLGSFVLNVDTLAGGNVSYHNQKLPDNCVGKDISIKITSNATGDAPRIEGVECVWEALYEDL